MVLTSVIALAELVVTCSILKLTFSGEGASPLIQMHLKTKLLTSFHFVNYNPTDANLTNPCGLASSSELT